MPSFLQSKRLQPCNKSRAVNRRLKSQNGAPRSRESSCEDTPCRTGSTPRETPCGPTGGASPLKNPSVRSFLQFYGDGASPQHKQTRSSALYSVASWGMFCFLILCAVRRNRQTRCCPRKTTTCCKLSSARVQEGKMDVTPKTVNNTRDLLTQNCERIHNMARGQ